MSTKPSTLAFGGKKSTNVRTIHRAIQGTLRLVARLSPRLAARAAAALFFVCPPRRRPAVGERATLARGRRFTVPSGAGRLPAWSWGAGPVVLLVHGWGGNGSQMAAFVEPLRRAGFRPVLLDLPGHGGAPGMRSSLPEWAAALRNVAAVMNGELGVHAIIAHSFGCAAAALAIDRGLRVETAVFLAPVAEPTSYFQHFVGGAVADRTAVTAAQRRIEQRLGIDFTDLSVLTIAARQQAPLLVVHDADDRETPFQGGASIARAWPGGELMATRGLGHRRVLADRAVIERAVAVVAAGLPRSQQCAVPGCQRALSGRGELCEVCALEYELGHPHLRWVRREVA
jgi:pimeloyl-ACP methyl ester carboxylesterase